MLILKQKSYDYKEKIIKLSAVVLVVILIALLMLNFYFKRKIANLNVELEEINSLTAKYRLLKESADLNTGEKTAVILNKISIYTQNIELNYLEYQKQQLLLKGNAESEKAVFDLYSRLKEDNIFNNTELKKMEKRENINFEMVSQYVISKQ